MKNFFKDKRILVTGACGTVGQELVRQLLEEYAVGELVGLDNNESDLFFIDQRFAQFPQASFFLADVRDKDKLRRKMAGIDIVFHTAAFKHVILCERSPFEAAQTNVLGGAKHYSGRYCQQRRARNFHQFRQGRQSDQCDGNFQAHG
jgi:FlaA1/EpsC-like NDP-sugar epimerase